MLVQLMPLIIFQIIYSPASFYDFHSYKLYSTGFMFDDLEDGVSKPFVLLTSEKSMVFNNLFDILLSNRSDTFIRFGAVLSKEEVKLAGLLGIYGAEEPKEGRKIEYSTDGEKLVNSSSSLLNTELGLSGMVRNVLVLLYYNQSINSYYPSGDTAELLGNFTFKVEDGSKAIYGFGNAKTVSTMQKTIIGAGFGPIMGYYQKDIEKEKTVSDGILQREESEFHSLVKEQHRAYLSKFTTERLGVKIALTKNYLKSSFPMELDFYLIYSQKPQTQDYYFGTKYRTERVGYDTLFEAFDTLSISYMTLNSSKPAGAGFNFKTYRTLGNFRIGIGVHYKIYNWEAIGYRVDTIRHIFYNGDGVINDRDYIVEDHGRLEYIRSEGYEEYGIYLPTGLDLPIFNFIEIMVGAIGEIKRISRYEAMQYIKFEGTLQPFGELKSYSWLNRYTFTKLNFYWGFKFKFNRLKFYLSRYNEITHFGMAYQF